MPAAKWVEWTTDENMDKIKAWVAEGLSDAQIATKMGVGKDLLSKWRRKYPKLKDALTRYVDSATGKPIDRHELVKKVDSRRAMNSVATLKGQIDTWMEERRKNKMPLTVSSLCLYLHISKQTYYKYRDFKDENTTEYEIDQFTGEYTPIGIGDVLKRAELAIESDLEDRMITGRGNVTGAIFDLKNHHGYVDAREVNSTVNDKREKPTKDAEIDARIEELIAKSKGETPKLRVVK